MDTPDIDKLSQLARIGVPEEKKEALQRDLENILVFINQISEAKVSHEEKVVGTPHNVMRADGPAHEGGLFTDTLLQAATKTEKGYVKVKNIF